MSILDKYNLNEVQRDRVMTKVASTISELQKTDMLEKVAIDWHSPVAQTGLALAATTIGAGISVGIPKLVDAIRAAGIRRSKDEYLKAMKDAHPELKNVSQRDLDLAYNSVAMNSPDVLKDPLLGGQVMKEITGRAMRWDLNQYSTLNRTAGGGLADYEHAAIQQFGKGVGNLTNVYYDASAKADQAKRDQDRLDLSERVHTYNTGKDTEAKKFRDDQVAYQKLQDTAAKTHNDAKLKLEQDKHLDATKYQNKQLLHQQRQFSAQERRDSQQQKNFERTFNANKADRTFQQNMATDRYTLDQVNQAYNMGFNIERDGDTLNRYDVAHREAFSRAQGDLNFKMQNAKDINTLTRNQSYNQAMGQTVAENKNYDYHMNKAYDMGYHGTTGKNDAPATFYDTKTGKYIGNKPGNYQRPYK